MIKNKSFTLIELLVVIVIIGILAGVIIVSTSSSISKANIAKVKVFENSIQNELGANMVSRWKLDEIISITTTPDAWGNNTGTLGDGVTASTYPTVKSESECVTGKCIYFDGANDYIDCGNDSSLNFGKEDSFTFSVWVKRTGTISGTTKVAGILMNGSSNVGRYGIDYYQGLNQLRCGIRENSSYVVYVNPNDNLLNWNFVVFTYEPNNSTGIKLYLNGVLEESRTSEPVTTLNNTTLKIASDDTLGGDKNYFPGLIDDVRIYNAALSTSQIKQEYVAGLDLLLANGNISRQEYDQRLNNLAYDKE